MGIIFNGLPQQMGIKYNTKIIFKGEPVVTKISVFKQQTNK